MNILSEYTAWVGFLGTLLAQAEIDETVTLNQLETKGAEIMIANWSGRSADRVALAKARRETDPEYIKLRDAHLESRAYRKMMERFYLNVDGEKATVSREITRRVGREPVERRVRRWDA